MCVNGCHGFFPLLKKNKGKLRKKCSNIQKRINVKNNEHCDKGKNGNLKRYVNISTVCNTTMSSKTSQYTFKDSRCGPRAITQHREKGLDLKLILLIIVRKTVR